MLKELSVGLVALCNGHYYDLDSLENGVEGLFDLRCSVKEEKGVSLISPVIKNTSSKEICFNRAFVSVTLPSAPYEAYTQYSLWGDENRGHWAALDGRGILLTHANARTTEGNTPYIALRQLGRPEGVALHVLPIGDWRIRVQPLPYSNTMPKVRVDLGISDEALAFRLQPGEEWELPQVILQHFKDFELASGQLHRFILNNMDIPRRPMPVEFNTWLDTYSNLDVPRLREQLKAAKEIGCEIFVIDAGWFGPTGPGWQAVGDWRERDDGAFFGKMKEFADEVRAAGLGFGIWTEPERFFEKAPVVLEHPDWFIPVKSGHKCCRIDLENPAAYEYQKRTLLDLIEKYDLKYMKTDMNTQQGIDDTGAAHYRYSKLYYQLIDEIRALHPDFIIENCASGALRTDLESIKHFDIAFPSDNGNPFAQNDILAGFWYRFLPGQLMKWLVLRQIEGDVPFFTKEKKKPLLTPNEATWEEYEQVDMESLLAANFTGGYYGFTGDLASLTPENRALAAKYVALFKEKRNFMRNCEGYCIHDTERFKALQLSDGKDALFILQYIASDQVEVRTIYPVALCPECIYTFNGKDYTGAEIMENGLVIPMKYVYQQWKKRAELIELKRK